MNPDRQAVLERYTASARRAYEEGRFWETVQIMEQVMEHLPGQAELHYLYARALAESPKWRKQAESEFLKAIALEPMNLVYRVGLAAMYRRAGAVLKSGRVLKEARQAIPFPAGEKRVQAAALEQFPQKDAVSGLPRALILTSHPGAGRFAKTLQQLGCEARIAANVFTAKEMLQAPEGGQIGILFLSIDAADGDIHELMRRSRAARKGAPVICIGLVEGSDVLPRMEKARACGLMGFTTVSASREALRGLAARLGRMFHAMAA